MPDICFPNKDASNQVACADHPVAEVDRPALELAQIGLLAQTASPHTVDYDVCDLQVDWDLAEAAHAQAQLPDLVLSQVPHFLHVFGDQELVPAFEVAQ